MTDERTEGGANDDTLRAQVRAIGEAEHKALRQIAKEAGVGDSTFSAWMNGTYAGRNEVVSQKVSLWLRSRVARETVRSSLPAAPAFVPTPTAEAFLGAFDYAQNAPDLVVCAGVAGVGKTTAVREYRNRASNVWVVTGEPCYAQPQPLLMDISDLLGVDDRRSAHRMSRAIVVRMRGTAGLLIVDEAQHLSSRALDQLRTLHDLAEIGVALVGNQSVFSRIEGSARETSYAQLYSRVGMRVVKNKPTAKDVDMLLDAWSIPAAGEPGGAVRQTLHAIGRKPGGLRGMTKVLRVASLQAAAAAEDGQPGLLTEAFVQHGWKHLAAAPLDRETK